MARKGTFRDDKQAVTECESALRFFMQQDKLKHTSLLQQGARVPEVCRGHTALLRMTREMPKLTLKSLALPLL